MSAEFLNSDVIISVTDLKKSFDTNLVLNGINIDIKKGDVLCVIGASGSGKSTFLRCLNLLEKPTSGSIIFEGDDLMKKDVDINLHRQKMGMVFQQFNLFPHLTILRNLTIGPTMLKGVSEDVANKRLTPVTTERLGSPRIVEQAFEDPNGEPLDFSYDVAGNKRGDDVFAGPFAYLSAGENKFVVWKK